MSKAYISLESQRKPIKFVPIFVIYSICMAEAWVVCLLTFQINPLFFITLAATIPFILIGLKVHSIAKSKNRGMLAYLNEEINPNTCILEEMKN